MVQQKDDDEDDDVLSYMCVLSYGFILIPVSLIRKGLIN